MHKERYEVNIPVSRLRPCAIFWCPSFRLLGYSVEFGPMWGVGVDEGDGVGARAAEGTGRRERERKWKGREEQRGEGGGEAERKVERDRGWALGKISSLGRSNLSVHLLACCTAKTGEKSREKEREGEKESER